MIHWGRAVIKLSYCHKVKRKYFFSQWGKVCLCDKIKSCHCNNLISIWVSSVSQDWESYKYRWSDFVEEIYTKFYAFNYFFMSLHLTQVILRAIFPLEACLYSSLLIFLKILQLHDFWHQNSGQIFKSSINFLCTL